MKILYMVHDLSDPAVRKRVAMLQGGGAAVTVMGFRRTSECVRDVMGAAAVDLGRTYNGGFVQRILSILREIMLLRRHRVLFAAADIVMARNLEMLALAVRGGGLCAPSPVLIYESLDIHRLLLNRGPIGAVLRALEGWLSRRASALITSSPAFVSSYFEALSKVRLPVILVENKLYRPAGDPAIGPDPSPRLPGPPWKIGWFGAIRCRESLRILTELVRRSEGAVEVVIRGRPAFDQFEDFHQSTTATPGLRFLGPYENPGDLPAMYREVHLTWAIDMFEAGLNSAWLLPNRLYEGGAFGSVPVALAAVATGRFLDRLGIGVILAEPIEDSLAAFFKDLTPSHYHRLEAAAMAVPSETWVCDTQNCREIVSRLKQFVT